MLYTIVILNIISKVAFVFSNLYMLRSPSLPRKNRLICLYSISLEELLLFEKFCKLSLVLICISDLTVSWATCWAWAEESLYFCKVMQRLSVISWTLSHNFNQNIDLFLNICVDAPIILPFMSGSDFNSKHSSKAESKLIIKFLSIMPIKSPCTVHLVG